MLGSLGEVDGVPEMIGRAWNWFREQLQVIAPRSDFYMLPARIAQDNLFAHAMSRGLSTADTGISQIKLEDFILSVLKKIDPTMGVALLGIGMCCIGFSLLDAETPIKAVRKSRKK